MTKRIIVAKGANSEIAKIFNCTPQFVGQCLYFKVKKGKKNIAIAIRSYAVRHFDGKEVKF
jgi:hypothetical protein